MQTTAHEEKLERCRMGANEQLPFACPEGCLFYEPRKVSGAGWTIRRGFLSPSGVLEPGRPGPDPQAVRVATRV